MLSPLAFSRSQVLWLLLAKHTSGLPTRASDRPGYSGATLGLQVSRNRDSEKFLSGQKRWLYRERRWTELSQAPGCQFDSIKNRSTTAEWFKDD
ncbi:hypothetical protein B0H17DRAFT_1044341 [Mycena rosella]|uniref:Secreted protein n=1 Tax=Mycena rosella TaxID=1033263 RepID=A0AAD7GQW1_MYCRO|nr:hypothetical protein B0H17DRAFT_1044341 [Mycena rosella]